MRWMGLLVPDKCLNSSTAFDIAARRAFCNRLCIYPRVYAYPSSRTPALEARRSTTYRVGSCLRRTRPDSGTHSPPPCRCRSLRGGMATRHSRPRLRQWRNTRLSITRHFNEMIATHLPCGWSWMAPGKEAQGLSGVLA